MLNFEMIYFRWCTKLHKCGNALEMSGSTDKTRITLGLLPIEK